MAVRCRVERSIDSAVHLAMTSKVSHAMLLISRYRYHYGRNPTHKGHDFLQNLPGWLSATPLSESWSPQSKPCCQLRIQCELVSVTPPVPCLAIGGSCLVQVSILNGPVQVYFRDRDCPPCGPELQRLAEFPRTRHRWDVLQIGTDALIAAREFARSRGMTLDVLRLAPT